MIDADMAISMLISKDKKQQLENYLNNYFYEDDDKIFYEVVEGYSDFEALLIGTRIVKNAMDRLDREDLDNRQIRKEYKRLGRIVEELKDIILHYV